MEGEGPLCGLFCLKTGGKKLEPDKGKWSYAQSEFPKAGAIGNTKTGVCNFLSG